MSRDPSWLRTPRERHRPPHQTDRGRALFLTASTVGRKRHLASCERRDYFWELIRSGATARSIELIAWVILEEHYHLIIVPAGLQTVEDWIEGIHACSSRDWNREDNATGRQVWYQYWDRSLWTDGDFWSRINYIHANPVKHGYVSAPENWLWSSYRSFAETDDPEQRELGDRFPAPLRIPDDDF
jgi:putative transposase